jgi:hypothetical protein
MRPFGFWLETAKAFIAEVERDATRSDHKETE